MHPCRQASLAGRGRHGLSPGSSSSLPAGSCMACKRSLPWPIKYCSVHACACLPAAYMPSITAEDPASPWSPPTTSASHIGFCHCAMQASTRMASLQIVNSRRVLKKGVWLCQAAESHPILLRCISPCSAPQFSCRGLVQGLPWEVLQEGLLVTLAGPGRQQHQAVPGELLPTPAGNTCACYVPWSGPRTAAHPRWAVALEQQGQVASFTRDGSSACWIVPDAHMY